MADEPQFGAELHAETTADRHGIRHDQLTGAFFPQAQHFVVAGGQFKSITNVNNAAPIVPFDFRRIPLGDLDLLNEIRFSSDVVHRKYGRHSVRRLYSARIYGSKSPMTVALYRGDTAEEEWRRDVSQYSSLRHPNLVQLFATASSSGIYAAIFHDSWCLLLSN
ncbi:hypothetical protein FB451DRAFT_1278465 [Mycena latifolia]|nr:hypothetical protein FB451DRAFT_1278465 [Mycena latifolia]